MGREIRFLSMVLLSTALFAACAPQPPQARVRQEAGHRLLSCLRLAEKPYRGEGPRRACVDDNIQFCRERGVEGACGIGEVWTARR